MKLVKKLPLLLLVTALYFVPVQSRAGVIGDLLHALFGNNNNKNKDKDNGKDKQKDIPAPAAATGNSVPLDEAVVFLMVAGLGLGAKMLYDVRAKKKVAGEL
ncbi:MAG TPA: hypothetical protein VHC96_11505 [Puia sp.]|jgi:hypothetical protein|nr:hypothetical protein [Puia sp.]